MQVRQYSLRIVQTVNIIRPHAHQHIIFSDRTLQGSDLTAHYGASLLAVLTIVYQLDCNRC
jgi:predicted transcriptional regulator